MQQLTPTIMSDTNNTTNNTNNAGNQHHNRQQEQSNLNFFGGAFGAFDFSTQIVQVHHNIMFFLVSLRNFYHAPTLFYSLYILYLSNNPTYNF